MPGKLGFYITDEFNNDEMGKEYHTTTNWPFCHTTNYTQIFLGRELCSTMHTLLELFAADSDMFH